MHQKNQKGTKSESQTNSEKGSKEAIDKTRKGRVVKKHRLWQFGTVTKLCHFFNTDLGTVACLCHFLITDLSRVARLCHLLWSLKGASHINRSFGYGQEEDR